MLDALRDLKQSFRSLVKTPGVTVIAVIALGLGIGLTAVMFSIVYGALYRPLPFENGERLMAVRGTSIENPENLNQISLQDYHDILEQQQSFEDLSALFSGTVNIAGDEGAERFQGGFVTGNAFDPISVQPIMGRLITEEDNEIGAPLVILLGHHVWTNYYGADPDVLGQNLRVNGELATVIGVMPEGFRFPNVEDVWVPMRRDATQENRGTGTFVEIYGLLREGVDQDRAQLDITGIASRLEEEYPLSNDGVLMTVAGFTEPYIGREAEGILLTMMFGVVLVLLIACANVANLLLARASVQTRDLAVRTAMGASRGRLILKLLTEALALATVGALLGLAIAWVGIISFTSAVASTSPPYWLEFRLDWVVLLFVTAAAGLAALASGILPAIQASGTDVSGVLKDESRGSSSLRMGLMTRALVIGQITFSVAVLVQAGLMVKSVINVQTNDYGFATHEVFTARLGLFAAEYPDTLSRVGFFNEVKRTVEEQPGVVAAALTNSLPGTGSGSRAFAMDGQTYGTDQEYPVERWALITPDFFETFGVEVLAGRGFTDEDDLEGLPVTIVNESFVARHFPNEDPLGKRIRMGTSQSQQPWMTIVGVVPDMWMEGVGNNAEPDPQGFYSPLAQNDARFMSLAVLTRDDGLLVTPMVREQVARVGPTVPLYNVDSMRGALEANLWFINVFGTLFIAFGLAALFMASIGLYGVMSFAVSRRTQELGIRMALGAAGSQVRGMVLKQGLFQVGIGLFFGLLLAFVLAGAMQTLLFLVEPSDPSVFIGIAAIIIGTGLLATFIPALRATRVAPVTALRYE